MSTKTENFHRNSGEDDATVDFDYFITSELPIEQIYNMLKLLKKTPDEVDQIVEKVHDARETIRKTVRKYIGKLVGSEHVDIPELIKKGIKYAKKAGLSDAELTVFKNHVMRGDIYGQHSYSQDLKYTPMSKFLGFDQMTGQMINLAPKDHSKLNELHMLYDETKLIHADVKMQRLMYRDCAPEAITGAYDRNRHNVNVAIHPVVAALFLPKVEYIDRRMLQTNIARMVLSRGQAYLKGANFHLQAGIEPGELDAEFELAYDIAHDPNALEYIRHDTPIDNMINRFRCQVELYRTVLNLRQGRYYATDYAANDGIAGFLRTLNSFDWTFFDSPELHHVQDEGTVLRKLLAVFSCRPTFTQLTSVDPARAGIGYTGIGNLARTVFVNIPIVNIKLPIDPAGTASATIFQMNLSRSLTQVDFFIEHKMLVPKHKSVVYSNKVVFFYANRRYPTVTFQASQMNIQSVGVPVTFANHIAVNSTQVLYDPRIRIGQNVFSLRSVVMLNRSPNPNIDIALGCAAGIVMSNPLNPIGALAPSAYIYYNPSFAAIQYHDPTIPPAPRVSQYVANSPVAPINELPATPNEIGFRTEAQERGTIFFYAA